MATTTTTTTVKQDAQASIVNALRKHCEADLVNKLNTLQVLQAQEAEITKRVQEARADIIKREEKLAEDIKVFMAL